ncbi:MAG: AmmeMemoRadiSam system protein A [Tumebacillaceae bacterium]
MSENLLLGTLLPHPPLVIPEVGGEELKQVLQTQAAMRRIGAEVVDLQPDVVVVISPHGPMFEDAVSVMGGAVLQGDLEEFGADVTFAFDNDEELAQLIVQFGRQQNVPLYVVDEGIKAEFDLEKELDYGATVPLYYVREAGYRGPVVLLSPGFVNVETLYRAGMCVQYALRQLNRRAVLIASGDNSHALLADAPAGYREEGPKYDALLQRAIGEGDWLTLMTLEEGFLEVAAEDTVRSLAVLLGAHDLAAVSGEVLSYEGPFGVGYTVARFAGGGETESLLHKIVAAEFKQMLRVREQESFFVRLAREALETYVREERVIEPPAPLPPELQERAGCYVSLKMRGRLRGCIGTVEPGTGSLAEEIIRNAIASGVEDDRFFPVEEDELEGIVYTVDVLEPEEPVHDRSGLDPQQYGLIVIKDDRSALLLPNLQGVNTVEEQIQFTKEKAGIQPDEEDVEYFRFRVTRYR